MRAVLAIAVLLVAAFAARAAPLPIRVAWTSVPAELTPVLLEKKDLLDRLGKSYTVEPVHFGESATVVRALAAGEIDLAALPPPAFAFAVRNAGLDDLRIVADLYRDGAPHHYASEFLVREASGIRTIDDLAGKILAVDALGGMSDLALRVMLQKHGIDPRQGAHIAVAPVANQGAMLEAGKIDLAALGAPFSYMLTGRGTARPLFTLRDALGPSDGLVLVARAGFVAENHAALVDFFEDHLRALRWFLDPAHRDEAVLIVASFTHAPRALYDDYLFTDGDYFRDRGARPDVAALQHSIDALRDMGFLDIAIDVRHYVDLNLIDEAAKRLD
jgi:NitT/TauT family transport system substrate-binding protein